MRKAVRFDRARWSQPRPEVPGGAFEAKGGTAPTKPPKDMDITQFKKDPAKEAEGVWIDGPEGCRFLIRSADAKQYRRALMRLSRQVSPAKLRKDPDAQLRMVTQAMAEATILDWTGVEQDGKPLACTPENRLALLQITELRELISTEAQDIANFRSEALEADAADLKSDD